MAKARLVAGTVAVLFSALPLHAEVFTPPAGCTLTVTVQSRQCTVANYYSCADAPGDQWISYADGTGEFFVSRIDSETRWIESYSRDTGKTDRLSPDSADNASFSELLQTGRDDYDFITSSTSGEDRRYVGYDLLAGGQVTIDGVPLERSEFDLTTFDSAGNFISRRHGQQYISRSLRSFFSDSEDFENAYGDAVHTEGAPVLFEFPGEPGFGATKPIYDCDVLMTSAPADPTTIRPTL
ncbi:hypothetical protein [Phaeovulum sp. W22_SRMD_FR3]|uniref:hypothetical protein n=1 Tax=Phaeovulum sp. W22_SRMD_FR3 TaxID=3240274 RepID=UPI003F95A4FA